MSSQAQTSQNRASDKLSGVELERKANEVVHFVLIWEQKKIPIKRADINKHVLKDHKSSFSDVIKVVAKKLEKVFGIKLVEIGEGAKKAYMLVNTLDHSETSDVMKWKDNSKRGLLFTILTLIFMSGNSIMDGALWHSLKRLGIEKDHSHSVFGDVKKLITQEFSRQMYLDISKVPNCDPPQYEYRWGQRAFHDIPKRKILEFVTKLYDKSDIMVWKSQYQDMIADEMNEQQSG
ncbi:non-structural maintenance of chromosomes element 3 homolog [Clavelina lepadiformis]|uniref:MAGE domain-containing protein n=1 Tax=Clavelina lepadiformis TaxID=159417 RepID=A0ABP0GCD0_CLALP